MNQTLSFELVRPVESDARLVMQWRNDPETLQMSYHSLAKQWKDFYPEFLRDYFAFPDLPPLFLIHDKQRAVFLRFRPVPNPFSIKRRCCDISIIVAPDLRG